MEDIFVIVAQNLKQIRNQRNLSINELAEMCGLSKSMLSQIEKGEGNPTLGTLWKIANALALPFDALVKRKNHNCELITLSDISPILEDGGRTKNYSVFPDDGTRKFAVYFLVLEPKSAWSSEPHIHGTTEFITVVEGILELTIGTTKMIIKKEESVRFSADVPHAYRNIAEGVTKLHMILSKQG